MHCSACCRSQGSARLTACNPASLAYLITPFVDDKEQPKCKIAEKNKEVTVAIVTWFGNREMHMYPETLPADGELSERLASNLRQRYAANKDKVKIVPYAQVRNYQKKQVGDTWSPADVGKLVKADKVIALEINAMSLYEKGSLRSQALFHGNLDVAIKVYDLAKPARTRLSSANFTSTNFPRATQSAPTSAPLSSANNSLNMPPRTWAAGSPATATTSKCSEWPCRSDDLADRSTSPRARAVGFFAWRVETRRATWDNEPKVIDSPR